jgi:hypothetical protein
MASLHDAIYDAASPGHDASVHLCGAGFQEHRFFAQYTPSVTTESSLPLSHHHRRCSMVADNIDRGYYSDTAESIGHNMEQADPGFMLTPKSRNPNSMLPASQSIRRWQREQDDWQTAYPARSVAHAKRRHKHRVRRSLNKIDAVLTKSPGKSHADGTKARDESRDNSSAQS